MGFVTNDPKKADNTRPGGGHGLVVDLGLRACPECRREVPDWQDECGQCGVAAVPRTELGSAMPEVPAHLLADEGEVDSEDEGRDDAADEST